jgi:YggT family protein
MAALPAARRVAILARLQESPVSTTIPILGYWYYHLPNFLLAALMYTLLGRVLLSLFVEPDSSNYIWHFFCRITDPFVALVAAVTPKAAAPVVVWLFGFVWLFWLRVGLIYAFLVAGAGPRAG